MKFGSAQNVKVEFQKNGDIFSLKMKGAWKIEY